MKRIFLFAAVTAVAMSSCSKNEVAINKMDPANAIGFGSYMGGNTKAEVEDAWEANDVITIDAYYTAGDAMASATPVAFMQDQAVTYGGAKWTYSPIKYWPNNTGDKVSFFAVSDATGSSFDFDADLTGNKPSFTVDAASSDIMVASKIDETKPTDGIVEFEFKHTMSQVNFTVKLREALDEPANTTVKVTEFKVNYGSAPVGGTFEFDNAEEGKGAWVATAGGTARDEQVWDDAADAGVLVALDAAEKVIAEPLMILPVTGAAYTATLTYEVATVDSVDPDNNSTIENVCTFDIAPEKMNTIYNYNMIIGLESVDVDADILGWDTGKVEKNVKVETSTGVIS